MHLLFLDLCRHRDYAEVLRAAGGNVLLGAGLLSGPAPGLSA
jgi:hypothetical protein